MTVQELIDQIAEVQIDSRKSYSDILEAEVIIEDFAGVEFVIEKIYYSENNGIGFDIKPRF